MAIKAFELFGEVSLKGGSTTLTGLKNISIQVNTTEKDLAKLRNEIDKTSKSHSNFSQGFLSSFGIQRGNGIGSLLGAGAGNLLQSGVKALYGHVTDAMDQGMQFADQIQKWKFGFTSMAGDEAKGLAHLMELMKYGKDSAFETTDVVNFAQQLEAVKVKAGEVIPMLEGIGGALAKSGKFSHEALEGSVLAITQILSKGQVSAEEMQRQLSQYIPNPYGFAARGLNRLGYRDDGGREFSDATVRQYAEEKRFNPDAFVRILADQFREESKGLLEKFVSGSISGTQAQLEDTKLFLFAQSMLGGGDMLGAPGGAYAQRLQNLKTQVGLYSGPEAQKIGKNLGGTAELYYGLVGGVEERMFQSDWLTDLLHGDASGAKEKINALGAFIPQGLKDGITGGAKMVVDAASSVMGGDIWKGLTDFWETNSPSKRAERLGSWIAEGLEMGLSKGQSKNYANLKALSQADPNFIKTLAAEAAKRGVNPDDMLNLIGIESGFNKSVVNKWGYGGLGQVGPDERASIGLPRDSAAFKKLLEDNTASWQLINVVFKILDQKLKENPGIMRDGRASLAEIYAAWGSGHATGDPNAVHMVRGGKRASAYANNPLWDVNKDGVVRESEFGQAALASLGAGKFFSVNNQADVSRSNPMPVQIVDYGNGVDYRSGPSVYSEDSGLKNQINTARNMYSSRRSLRSAVPVGTLNDSVPVNVDVFSQMQPLKTSMIMLTESALNFKKPLDLLADSATAAGNALGLTKESLESDFGPLIKGGKKKKKKDKLFDEAFTREGVATDFQGGLQGLLSGLGWEKPSSLGKQFLIGMVRDIQGRLAHDFSSMITGALFGHRKGGEGEDANTLTGGLFGGGGFDLGGILSKLFGSLFGGHRALGGGMSPGRFYVAGERGPEIITGPGYVYNNRETRQMMGGSDPSYTIVAIGDREIGRAVDAYRLSPRGRRARMIEGKYGRKLVAAWA